MLLQSRSACPPERLAAISEHSDREKELPVVSVGKEESELHGAKERLAVTLDGEVMVDEREKEATADRPHD